MHNQQNATIFLDINPEISLRSVFMNGKPPRLTLHGLAFLLKNRPDIMPVSLVSPKITAGLIKKLSARNQFYYLSDYRAVLFDPELISWAAMIHNDEFFWEQLFS